MTHGSERTLIAATAALICLSLGACAKPEPTPTPAPFPTALPSPTPPLQQIIDETHYVVLCDDVEIAAEEIHAIKSDDSIIITSELHYLAAPYTLERRTVVVNTSLSPMRYELERVTAGVRSLWVAERTTRGTDILNNHQVWPGPIAHDGVSPAADMMLEAAPSTLAYVLLALKSTMLTDTQPSIEIDAIDIIEDLPVSRQLTLKAAPGRKGAVIGTAAIEGTMEGGPNPTMTLWVRPDSGALYGAKVAEFSANPWLRRAQPSLADSVRLEIKRVSDLQSAPEPQSPNAELLSVEASDGKMLAALLQLPQAAGPHPCLVSLGAGDITTHMDLADQWLARGWAICAVDPRGTGKSEGTYQRGDLHARAEDATAVARAIGARSEIDADRIVLLGMGDAGLAGLLALDTDATLAGVVVGSAACHLPLLPDLAMAMHEDFLAPNYGWTPDLTEAFELASVDQWQHWLFEDKDEISLVHRRVPLQDLRAYADTDITKALAESEQPILLLVGEQATWPSAETQRDLANRLGSEGRPGVSVGAVPAADDILVAQPGGPMLPEAQDLVLDWLMAEGL